MAKICTRTQFLEKSFQTISRSSLCRKLTDRKKRHHPQNIFRPFFIYREDLCPKNLNKMVQSKSHASLLTSNYTPLWIGMVNQRTTSFLTALCKNVIVILYKANANNGMGSNKQGNGRLYKIFVGLHLILWTMSVREAMRTCAVNYRLCTGNGYKEIQGKVSSALGLR